MARSGDWQHGEVGGQDAGMVSLVTRPPSTLYMAAGARPLGDWCRGAPCRVPVSASPRPDHRQCAPASPSAQRAGYSLLCTAAPHLHTYCLHTVITD